jgi:hypothetical protein
MNKIKKRIPAVKFLKSSNNRDGFSKSGNGTKNSAIKESQQSLQGEIYKGPLRKHNQKSVKIVNHFAKTASAGYFSGSSSAADIRQAIPTFYHPDFEPSSLILPKDRIEIISWCNYFYKYDALVATAVDLHSELPLSKIRLDLPSSVNKKKANQVLEHYVDMIGNTGIDLFNKLLMFGVEYYKIGNVFPWAQMNSDGTKWQRLTCLDPNYVRLEKLGLTNAASISLIPDDRLRHIVHNGPYDEKTGQLYQTLSEDIIEYVMAGKEIPLSTNPNDGSHAAHLARKLADYVDWGTSIIERNFKTLVYKDRLRQSQDAIATRHLTPKHLIWADLASRADVNEIRNQVEDAMLNPDSAIITNYELHWELIGTSSGLMQLATEREWITEDLLVGLMISKNILLGDGKFAAGQTVLEVMNQRYAIFREVLESYIEKNLFLPIARNMGFVEYQPGTIKKSPKEVFLYPKVRWNRLNLTDDTQHKQMLAQAVAEGKVDVGTWLEYFGLNVDTIAERLKKNEDTVLDPVYNELRRSIMNEVGRQLGPAVAKVYAESYGLELDDSGGGFGMFGSSKRPLTKFGKEFDINYGKDGSLIINPKMETETASTTSKHSEKIANEFRKMKSNIVTADTREQRRHNRELNQSNRNIEESKKKYEVIDSESKKLKPPRIDLSNKVIKKDLFKSKALFDTILLKNAEESNDDSQEDNQIETKISKASELDMSYDNMPFQSLEKVKKLSDRQSGLEQQQNSFSSILTKKGVDETTRRLAKTSENEIASAYYSLRNSVKDNNVRDLTYKRLQQMYASIYHSIVNPKEPIFKSSQTVKSVFEEDIKKRAATLIKKIEIISDANRKSAEKTGGTNLHDIFIKSEEFIRKAYRDVIETIIDDVEGFLRS